MKKLFILGLLSLGLVYNVDASLNKEVKKLKRTLSLGILGKKSKTQKSPSNKAVKVSKKEKKQEVLNVNGEFLSNKLGLYL